MTAMAETKQLRAITKASRSRGRPNVQIAAEIDDELLDHALREFTERGYGATTMLDIIKAAGVAKTTVYSRFSSKEQIFRAIVARQAVRFATELPPEIGGSEHGLAESLIRFGNYLLKTTLDGPSLEVHRMLYSEARRFPELSVTMAERNKLGVARVSALIRDCASREGVPCKDPETAAEMFLLMINGWFTNALLSGQKTSDTQRSVFVDDAVQMFISGRSGW